jgi:hypothetical protein
VQNGVMRRFRLQAPWVQTAQRLACISDGVLLRPLAVLRAARAPAAACDAASCPPSLQSTRMWCLSRPKNGHTSAVWQAAGTEAS